MHKRSYAIFGKLLAVTLVLILTLTLTVGSASAAPPVAIQVAFVLDGSGSITSGNFALMRTGLANAVKDSTYVAQNGTIEITVVQFGTTGATEPRTPVYNVEVAPVVIDSQATANTVATQIEGIPQIGGWTPMSGGIDLAVQAMKYNGVNIRTNWSTASRHIINISSDGLPNTKYNGYVDGIEAKTQAVSAVATAVAEGVDEVDAEAVGISTSGIVWMADGLVYPQTAHAAIGAPYNLVAGTVRGNIIPPEPYPPRPPDPNFSGFVRVCSDWNDYKDAIKEKLEHLIPQINLIPLQDSNPARTDHEICAVVTENSSTIQGETIVFEVIGGPNAGETSGPLTTDANGLACWTYTDTNSDVGNNLDVITASGVGGKIDGLVATENASKLWTTGVEVPGIAGWGILATVIMLSALMARIGVGRLAHKQV